MRQALKGFRQACEFGVAGLGRWCFFAFRCSVVVAATRAKAHSARLKRFSKECAHLFNVLRCSCLLRQRTLFHDIHAQWVVRHLNQKI